MHAWEKGMEKRSRVPRDIRQSALHFKLRNKIWAHSGGSAKLERNFPRMVMRTTKMDRERIRFGTFADKTKSWAWHAYSLKSCYEDACARRTVGFKMSSLLARWLFPTIGGLQILIKGLNIYFSFRYEKRDNARGVKWTVYLSRDYSNVYNKEAFRYRVRELFRR